MKFIIIIILIFLFIACLGTAYGLVTFVLDRNKKMKQDTSVLSEEPSEVQRAIEILCGSKQWQASVEDKAEEWTIISYDHLKLQGYFMRNDSHRYVILCHGFTGSAKEMFGRAEYMFGKGFNVLIPNARAHGQSEGRYRGMGFLERKDMLGWIEKIVKEDADSQIVLFGQSMGAATVIMTSGEKMPPNVKAIISDCSYTSVWDEFSLQLKRQYHLPSFPIMNIANYMSKKIAGYSFKEASPINSIQRNHLPILLIHGDADTFVPCEYSEQLYEKANAPKYRVVVENAGHCMSVVKNGQKYWHEIDSFLKEVL